MKLPPLFLWQRSKLRKFWLSLLWGICPSELCSVAFVLLRFDPKCIISMWHWSGSEPTQLCDKTYPLERSIIQCASLDRGHLMLSVKSLCLSQQLTRAFAQKTCNYMKQTALLLNHRALNHYSPRGIWLKALPLFSLLTLYNTVRSAGL